MANGKHIPLKAVKEALAKAPKPFVVAWEQGDLTVELFEPRGVDSQKPHDRDEIYVVISGEGRFRCGEEIMAFRPGDVLFVPAWLPHRFEDFSDDLSLWVFFFGPSKPQGKIVTAKP